MENKKKKKNGERKKEWEEKERTGGVGGRMVLEGGEGRRMRGPPREDKMTKKKHRD